MSDRDHAEWSGIGITAQQDQGAIRIEQSGDAHLGVSGPWKPVVDSATKLQIHLHTPEDSEDFDDTDSTVNISLSLSPDTAAELGEWLCEHADDEPARLMEGSDQ